MLLGLAVFVASVIADVLIGLYMLRLNQRRAFAAANYALLIAAIQGANVIGYNEYHWLIVPVALGNWLGTYIVTRWDNG